MHGKPQRIGEVLAQLVGRGRLGQVHGAAQWEAAWKQAAGPVAAKYTRVGRFFRGTLEVIVANSTLLQELSFRKQELVERLAEAATGAKLRQLRFRVGAIDSNGSGRGR